ncbi:T9SS type A sorting domain-containing protein [Flavobacterium psychrotolerans]|nr:T9SS type A sorting domain-containing protein [Flavobacterium psychrotolerans]
MKKTITLTALVLLFTNTIFAQWTAVNNGLPALTTRGVANLKDTLVTAVKDKGIFYSVNNGDTWSSWKFNAKLPNYSFNNVYGAGVKMAATGGGPFLSFTGQSMFSYYEHGIPLSNVPVAALSNQNIKCWIKRENPGVLYLGTNGGGVFYNPNNAGYSQSTGLTGGGNNINYISFLDGPNKTEIDVVATDNGVYRTDDFGKTYVPFNPGFTAPIRVYQIGLFTLTENGLFYFNKDTQTFMPLKPGGDYRTSFTDMVALNSYFFGNGVGTKMNLSNFQIDDLSLDGITGGAITSTTLVGDYIFVCTENGGVFRKALVNLGVNDFNQSKVAKFSVFPNPSNGEFKITSENPIQVQLIDLTGKIINSYRVENSATIKETLSSGIYLLKDSTNGGVKKMIIR